MTTTTTKVKFFVREFDAENGSLGEAQWLYDIAENNLADDAEHAFQSAIFAFEDGGSPVTRRNKSMWFTTADGTEYKVETEDVEDAE